MKNIFYWTKYNITLVLQEYNQAQFDEFFKEFRDNNLFVEDVDFLRSKVRK